MPKPKLVLMAAHGAKTFSPDQRRRLQKVCDVRFIAAPHRLSPNRFIKIFADAEIAGLTPRGTPRITARLLASLPKLKAIAIPTTGLDWIDVELISRSGIKMSHIPNFCSDSAAEFTWGLILALSKKIAPAHEWLRTGRRRIPHFRGSELHGKTLGVVGLGDIGSRVARIGTAFGMRVKAYDLFTRTIPGVKHLSLSTLLRKSDVITLHIPLDFLSRKMFNATALRSINPNAFLVNTARPGIVDSNTILQMLNAKKLAGYAYDIGYMSRADQGRLGLHPNVLAVPHISWYTKEASEREIEYWVNELVAMTRGRPRHPVSHKIGT